MPAHRLLRLCRLAFACASLTAGLCRAGETPAPASLIARAVLPAATFAPGPTSGRQLGGQPINGQAVPFVGHQPVQGFSGLVDDRDGTFLALCDNGYGAQNNSADFRLRVYRLRPWWKTDDGGPGTIEVLEYFELRDPDGRVPFPIVGQFTPERVLTGADFDPESIQRAPDGTLWIGDEFGPYLLHTDNTGRLLEAPIPLADPQHPGEELRSPENPVHRSAFALRVTNALLTLLEPPSPGGRAAPLLGPGEPFAPVLPRLAEAASWLQQAARVRRQNSPVNVYRVPGSGGFEAMAISLDGTRLYPLLEKALAGDARASRWIYEFDLATRRYTPTRRVYLCEPRGVSVPDFLLFAPGRGLVIERDSSRGDPNGFKAVFEISFNEPGGAVTKRLAADLMALDDSRGISSPAPGGDVAIGPKFGMPFVTIESLVVFDPTTIGVMNDNNYPFSIGRHVGSGQPDDNEFIVIQLPEPLGR